jgi:hypothetical protein
MAGSPFPFGETFYEYAAGGNSVNIARHTGGNTIGTVSGYDGVFVYVLVDNVVHAVPIWNVDLAFVTP